MLNGRNGGERDWWGQSNGKAMGADREQKATGWGEGGAAGVTLVTDAFFTPNWSEIKIS